MKQQRMLLLLLLLLVALASCSPGHLGGNEIAFVRDGHLWTIDPDGSNAFEVVSANAPVIGYAWSPNHQIFVFRTLDSTFASSSAGKHLLSNPLTGVPGDLPSTLNTIGIDGGTPIPIIFSSSGIAYSNAQWNTAGNRLLYREELSGTKQNPDEVSWWVSQNDQPGGIARKLLPDSYSIPSLSSNNWAIGNSINGVFTTTLAGTNLHYVIASVLPGHPLPAAVERVLWQPAHANPDILYAIAASSNQAQPFNSTSAPLQLILRNAQDHITVITRCTCTQFAWSPDGNSILYSTGSSYTVFNLHSNSSFTISSEENSIPYWSPDSQFLLLDGPHTLVLAQIATKRRQLLLSDGIPPSKTRSSSATEPDINALLQPVLNSLWAADSRHFLFLTRNRLTWQDGQRLSSGNGLYTVSIDSNGKLQGKPSLVDTENDSQPGWSYEDPNTSFLF